MRAICVCLLLPLLAVGCLFPNPELSVPKPPPFVPEPEVATIEDSGPPPVVFEPEPEFELPLPPAERGRLYSVQFNDADIQDVLVAIAMQSGLDIVFSPELQGSVTVYLSEVPLKDLLDAVLKTVGYTYVVESGIVHVVRRATRRFKIDYYYPLALAGTGTGTGTGAGAGAGAGASSRSASSRGRGGAGSFSQFWDELEDTLEDMKSDEGTLVVDPLSGLIVITDVVEYLDRMEQFLLEFSRQIRQQVIIEAQIVDVIFEDEYQFGIDWEALNLGLDWLDPNASARASQSLSPGGGVFGFVVSSDHVTAIMDALASQGRVNVLSSPRIAALNNQEARINVAEEIPYYQAVVSQETGKVIGWEVFFRQAGLEFSVIPQISRNGEVLLQVRPRASELVGYTNPSFAEPVPIIDVREAQTVVRVRDSQTAVIGGLIRDKELESVAMVPVLGKIPWLGTLFRKTIQTKKRSELVLFLTPHLMSTSAQIEEESRRRYESLEGRRTGFHLGPGNALFDESKE